MIRCLTGEVLGVTEASVLLDVHGLGFDVLCSRGALAFCRPEACACHIVMIYFIDIDNV